MKSIVTKTSQRGKKGEGMVTSNKELVTSRQNDRQSIGLKTRLKFETNIDTENLQLQVQYV
jgi:hypothetical protein